MTSELQRLVRAALGDAAPTALDWSRIVIYGSEAPLPSRRPAGDHVWNRGFHALILGPGGHPQYFCTCRRADDEAVVRASRICEALGAHPDLAAHVPWTRSARGAVIQVQVSAYVCGRAYATELPSSDVATWARSVEEVLHTAEHVTGCAARDVPGLWPALDRVDLTVVGEAPLAHMAAAGMKPDRCAALRRVLARGRRLPGRLQHGDLWPGNILRHGHSWCLLDYEVFGEVGVPLYDAFHLLRTSDRLRRPGAETWVASLLHETAETVASRAILGRVARRHGLGPEEVAAAFAYYVVDAAARAWRRQISEDFWQPVFAEAETVAELEASGVSLADLLLGDSTVGAARRSAAPVEDAALIDPAPLGRIALQTLVYAAGFVLSRIGAYLTLPAYTRQLIELALDVATPG
jgi:hypothetical protein